MLMKLLSLLCSLSIVGFTPALLAVTSSEQIEQRVATAVAAELQRQGLSQQPGQRVTYEVSDVDPRLRLANCDTGIQVDLGGKELTGRITAKVECPGPVNWSLYVPVAVDIYKQVVTTRIPAARGKLLRVQDLRLAEKKVTRLSRGYFTQIDQVANKQLRRSITLNSVITPTMLIEPKVVNKGDQVMITANEGSLSVRSPGEALMDGRIGEQIKVKNLASERIVKARIKRKGVVEVML